MGLTFRALATRDLTRSELPSPPESAEPEDDGKEDAGSLDYPLTIPEAKRRLAATLGVPESAVKIVIER
jgi:hypothetical protein